MRRKPFIISLCAATLWMISPSLVWAGRGGFVGGGGSIRFAGGGISWGDDDTAWNAGFGGAPSPAEMVANKQVASVQSTPAWRPSGSIQNSYASSSAPIPGSGGDNPAWLLVKMSNYLAAQQQLTLWINMTTEKVSESGEKIQVSSQHVTYARRPDRLAVDITTNDSNTRIIYDGAGVTALDTTRKFYGRIPVQGSLDQVLDTLARNYGMAVPADDLLYKGAYDRLAGKIKRADDLGVERLGDIMCQHAAFSGDNVDFQIWIQTGDQALPYKALIIYKNAPGRPRCVLEITRWDINPIPDSVFKVDLPSGARQITILPHQ